MIQQQFTEMKQAKEFISFYHTRYYMSMFCDIGFHSVKNGGWTIVVNGMVGTTYLNNNFFDFYPLFETDIEASLFCSLFCEKNVQFKNRGHIEVYDYLPLGCNL